MAILCTVPAPLLAAVFASLLAWLRALDGAASVQRQCTGDAAKQTARALAERAAEMLFDGEGATLDTERNVAALSSVWFMKCPYDVAAGFDSHDRGPDIEAAMADLDAVRATLLGGGETVIRPAEPREDAVRALVVDVARYLDEESMIDADHANLAVTVACFVSGRGCARDLLALAAKLSELARRDLAELAFEDSALASMVLGRAARLHDPSDRALAEALDAADRENPGWRGREDGSPLSMNAPLLPFGGAS